MNRLIRYRLLTIVLLGVLVSALSVAALVQLLTTSTSQRIERARDAVVDEVDRLARSPGMMSDPTRSGLIAMRGGVWTDASPASLSPEVVEQVRAVVAKTRALSTREVIESTLVADGGTLVAAARPVAEPEASHLPPGSIVFVVYAVRPLPSLQTWQRIVALLAGATALLVATALYSIVTVNRGATALRTALAALASDLHAEVPRPAVRELDGIADGIAELAKKLADARVKEEQLARELAQNERLAALGRVAAGVAHEVRNPLASIKLRLDLAAVSTAGAPLPESAQAAIAHATSEIDRLDRLVADLLMVAGRKVGPKRKLDLGDLARARVEALAPWASEREVKLEVSGSGPATVDDDAMARAVDNLLRNAVEAAPAGSSVVARVRSDGDHVVVGVEDEGAGVAENRSAELFEPFFTTKPAGTGLGLAISRAIARAHGGDVVYARDGDVTCFSLSVANA